MNKLTYKIYTQGCKVNQYDSGIIASFLAEADFLKCKNNEANLVIVNSCAVTQTAIKKAKRIIAKAKKENPSAKFFLIGCYPKAYAKSINRNDFDFIVGTNEVKKVLNKIFEIFNLKKQNQKSVTIAKSGRTRYTLKIQDGCEQFCSYCIIPYTRGKLKSRAKKEVLAEFKKVLENGCREIVLSGIHLGLYGADVSQENLLIDLIRDILKEEGNFRLRLSSIELNEVSAELIDLIKSEVKICSHLHIPLQSGSDKILNLMKRPYSTTDFENKIRKIRKKTPQVAISSDLIVGFPGETEKDFQETLNFAVKNKFSKIHIFPFSAHKKTKAALLPNRVNADTIRSRVEILRKKADILREEYKKNFYDSELNVLVEKKQGEICTAKSEYYFDVQFSSTKTQKGDLLNVSDWKFADNKKL